MKKIEMKKRKLPLNLQFFAGNDDGAEGGNGGGGNGEGAEGNTGTEGETTPPTFDDLLKQEGRKFFEYKNGEWKRRGIGIGYFFRMLLNSIATKK